MDTRDCISIPLNDNEIALEREREFKVILTLVMGAIEVCTNRNETTVFIGDDDGKKCIAACSFHTPLLKTPSDLCLITS